jgi:alpha-tubulin suppressor-like RCC1 family protein
MTIPSNYQNLGTDLDYSYVEANNPAYSSVVSAVSNRKTVMFGQQVLSQTNPYPIGNINNTINYVPNLLTPWVDKDSTNIIGVTPTSVFYNARRTTTGTTIRGQFNLLENYGQTTPWQYISNTQTSSPIQITSNTSSWTKVTTGFSTWSVLSIYAGTLWAWGLNSFGQLGTNNQINSSWPVQVGILSYWSQVACKNTFASAVQSNGTLWAWGANSFGQLGQQNQNNLSNPAQIGLLSNWTQVDTGAFFLLAIQSPGTLWACGYNNSGQLGQSNLTNRSSPVQVGTLSSWAKIACGQGYWLAIQSNGTLWSCGDNFFGQLGLSDVTNRSSPVQVGSLSYWTQISCGARESAAIQSDGTLWTWGSNSFGQLGLNTTTLSNVLSPVQVGNLSVWQQVSMGFANTMAIQSNGTLWAWGLNSSGQLGLNTQQFVPVLSPTQSGTSSNWVQISAGTSFTTAIQNNGSLWSWGNNSYGQLGFTPNGISVNKVTYGL